MANNSDISKDSKCTMSKEVGELTLYTSNDIVFNWNILPHVLYNEYHDSPPFYFSNAVWFLRMKKERYNTSDSSLSLYLVVRDPSSSYSVNFSLGTECCTRPCQFGPVTRVFERNGESHGKEHLFIVKCGVINYPLQVYCSIALNRITSLKSITLSCPDFQDVLLSGRNSDVTVVVGGMEFKAHKLILEAYSPVFAAMFQNVMAERERNVIKIKDYDPDAFHYFLQCVYAGRVDNLSVDKAIPLYMISHKYAVNGIVEKCARYLAEELNKHTVCDILALANRYDEANLKKAAEEFMAQNINKILSTTSWSTLTAENSLLQKYSYVSRNDVDRAILKGARQMRPYSTSRPGGRRT